MLKWIEKCDTLDKENRKQKRKEWRMYNQKHVVAKRIVFGLLALAMMSVAFFFSSQTGEESGALSDSIREAVIDFLNDTLNLKIEKTEENLNLFSFIVRKTAHFSEYFVMAIFVTLFMYTFKLNKVALSVISFFITALYAVSDEWHQSLVGGRAMMVMDMGIDSAGAFLAVIILLLIFSIAERKKNREEDIQVETYPI